MNPTAVGLCAITDYNGLPPCLAGTTAPAVTPTSATNTCPATTVSLASLPVSSTTPAGASLIWSTKKVPASAADTLTTAQVGAVSTAGTYYAMYYDKANSCYSPADSVVLTISSCTTPITLTNTCPTATVNLMTAISATNLPVGASVSWHTGTPATAANKVATPMAVSTSGTYYMAYFDANANCYSDVSQPVTVTLTACAATITTNTPPALTAATGTAKTGNAATDLAPTGGTAPYVYSNGAGDAACVAPAGATALPAGSLTVTSSGSYSYTAPATAGTYYFCIKVCDSTTPTATCKVSTYTLTVSSDADVLPNFTFGNTANTQGDQRTVIININNAGASPTSGNIELFVPLSSGFTYTFNAGQTSATVTAAEVVNNPDWTLTTLPTGLKFTSSAAITGNGRSRIALTVKADTKGTDANLTVNITPASGGETKGFNNIAVLAMSVQN